MILELDLNPASPVPLYLQLIEQVRRLIALGALQPGDQLPTVRDLAVRARVNRNTAARAVQHLEREGLVRTRVGQGTFVVADGSPRLDGARREQLLAEALDRLLIEAHTLGVPLEELGWRLSRRIEAFIRRRSEPSGAGPESK
jgi:GntR family transcriptional regulator